MTDPIPSGRAAKAGPAAVDISAPFDITAPLPRGTTVLEASAGTGKTWAIAALVARHVADGLPLDQLLVVTSGAPQLRSFANACANASSAPSDCCAMP